MLSKQEEDQERRETLENDLRVLRERGSTYHQHGVAQADELSQGRFAATGVPSVTGATPVPSYPAAGAHQADPVGTEPPLGFSVNDLGPSTDLSAVEQLGAPAAGSAPSSEVVLPLADNVEPGAGAPPCFGANE
jgi:hypothetical protein